MASPRALAVLPFQDSSPSPDQSHLAEASPSPGDAHKSRTPFAHPHSLPGHDGTTRSLEGPSWDFSSHSLASLC